MGQISWSSNQRNFRKICYIDTLGAKNVFVWNRVPPEKIAALHDELKRISPGYTENVCVAEHLKKGSR